MSEVRQRGGAPVVCGVFSGFITSSSTPSHCTAQAQGEHHTTKLIKDQEILLLLMYNSTEVVE